MATIIETKCEHQIVDAVSISTGHIRRIAILSQLVHTDIGREFTSKFIKQSLTKLHIVYTAGVRRARRRVNPVSLGQSTDRP